MDDSESMRAAFRHALGMLGLVQVDEAEDGEAGLHMLAEHHYDMVITDWQMPRMTGIEMLRRIRGIPELRALPVLMTTGVVTKQRVVEAAEAGVSGFLMKPFVTQTLEEKVRQYIGPPSPRPSHGAQP